MDKKKEKLKTDKPVLTGSLKENIDKFKHILSDEVTINYKLINNPTGIKLDCCIIFSESISSEKIINDKIIKPIMEADIDDSITRKNIIGYIENKLIQCRGVKKSSDLDFLITSIMYGDTILLTEGLEEALIIATREYETRGIEEPPSERVVNGPREGFTESLKVNQSLLRRKISSPNLKFKSYELGTVTKTRINICYIEGISSPEILNELEKRLNSISIDGVLDSTYIQALIKDAPYSPFKTIGNTERPDIVAAKLLEGRIALLCDGSPTVLTIPFLFLEYFQANEDYYKNYIYSSFNRLLRFISFFLTTSVPGIYVSLVAFHQELIPMQLTLSIFASRLDVPFPTIVELSLMLFFFELLQEGGIRLPLAIGQSMGIVGALILGEAAVNAKIISAPIVIITALTGISAFLVHKMKSPIIVIRILLLVASTSFGLYGYVMAVLTLIIYMTSIRSFGVPYMLYTSLINIDELKDSFARFPLWKMDQRPKFSIDPIKDSVGYTSRKRKLK